MPSRSTKIVLAPEDAEIQSEDIPGWLVANEGALTVALDINVTPELKEEGIARELINRIQNIRKDSGFDVTDKITVRISRNNATDAAIEKHAEYIGSQTLATSVTLADNAELNNAQEVEIDEETKLMIEVKR